MTKPMVFNYADHERALEEIARLKGDIANLQIRCRIAESDRDCKNCKHHKADGCSRWDCEYEPRMVEVVRCKDCRHSRIEGDTTLFMWCGYWNKPTDGNRYCSDGERKEP